MQKDLALMRLSEQMAEDRLEWKRAIKHPAAQKE